MDYNQILSLLNPIAKWLHIIAGVTWIGLLYFFNFINGHVAATMDGDTKRKVVPELMPRTLYWFRWGAAWTWVTGLLLLYIIFWHGSLGIGMTGEDGSMMADSEGTINKWTHMMIALTFLSVFVYDFIYCNFTKLRLASRIVSGILDALKGREQH